MAVRWGPHAAALAGRAIKVLTEAIFKHKIEELYSIFAAGDRSERGRRVQPPRRRDRSSETKSVVSVTFLPGSNRFEMALLRRVECLKKRKAT